MSDLALPIPLLIRVKHYMEANRFVRRLTSVGHKQFSFPTCWFACDITAAMLVIKNKSISFQRFVVLTTNMAAFSSGSKPRILSHCLKINLSGASIQHFGLHCISVIITFPCPLLTPASLTWCKPELNDPPPPAVPEVVVPVIPPPE